MQRFRKYSMQSIFLILTLACSITAASFAREKEPLSNDPQQWSSTKTCEHIFRCDKASAESPNFRADCVGFLDRTAQNFPVQAEAMQRCALQGPCAQINFAGCVRLFYRAIKFDTASMIPKPPFPPQLTIPIRKLQDWPASIPVPDAQEKTRMHKLCESRQQCPAEELNISRIPRSEKYCVKALITMQRVDPVQYQAIFECMEENVCSTKKFVECSRRREKEAREAARQTPEYKAAARAVRPYCQRVQECREGTEELDQEEANDLCMEFLIKFRDSPGHFEQISKCIKKQPCDQRLFSSCVSQVFKSFRE